MADRKLDFAFDKRVSGQYNAQRAHPPGVAAQVGESIAAIAGDGARILELGVGTGRIALPVVAAGCRVVGVDLSQAMLEQLAPDRVASQGKLKLVRADISRLPFRTDCFDAVTAVHVLHLVSDWREALRRAVESLRAGGHVILGRDWIDPQSMAGQLQREFRRLVVELMGPQLKAPTGGQSIADRLTELGAAPLHVGPNDLIAAEWQTQNRPAEILAAIASRSYAESWVLTDEMLPPVNARMKAFAETHWPDLGAVQPVRRRFLLSVFRRD